MKAGEGESGSDRLPVRSFRNQVRQLGREFLFRLERKRWMPWKSSLVVLCA